MGVGVGGSAGKIFATMLLHFVIPINLICNMTMFWKSLILTPPAGSGEFCRQNICYHVAAFVIPFNLIRNMTRWCSEKVEFDLLTLPPKSTQGLDPDLWPKITFDMFHFYSTSVCMRNFSKKYWQLTELLRNLNIWPLTPPKGSGGWGKILITVMLIYMHWAIMAYSEKLSDIKAFKLGK